MRLTLLLYSELSNKINLIIADMYCVLVSVVGVNDHSVSSLSNVVLLQQEVKISTIPIVEMRKL
jgi:hypothetical protein